MNYNSHLCTTHLYCSPVKLVLLVHLWQHVFAEYAIFIVTHSQSESAFVLQALTQYMFSPSNNWIVPKVKQAAHRPRVAHLTLGVIHNFSPHINFLPHR